MQVAAQKKRFGKQVSELLLNNAIIVGIILIAIFVGMDKPAFLSPANIRNLITNTAVRFIIAVGVSGCLITKGTDLSAGRTAGFAACVSAILLQKADYSQKILDGLGEIPIVVVVAAVLVLGGIIGAVNGSVISFFKVPPFIATLGMQTLVYGICLVTTGAAPIGGLRKDYTDFATAALHPTICLMIIAAGGVAVVAWLVRQIIRLTRASRLALLPALLAMAGMVALWWAIGQLVQTRLNGYVVVGLLGAAGLALIAWFVLKVIQMTERRKFELKAVILFILGSLVWDLVRRLERPHYSYVLVVLYFVWIMKLFWDRGEDKWRGFTTVLLFCLGAAVLILSYVFMSAVFSYVALVAYAVGLMMWTLYNKTRHGKYMYAIGGNENAAEVAGVNVSKSKIKIYLLAGMLYGLCGFVIGCRAGGASVNTAMGWELEAIAGCTIGGVSVNGGVGKINGILVGVLVFELLKIAMQFMGIETSYTYIVQGLVIIIAVALDLRKYLAKK